MSVVSRQEFANLCFIDIKKLNVYISRKDVVVLKDDKSKIDTENKLNLVFKKKWIAKNKLETTKPKPAASKKTREQNFEEIYKEVVQTLDPDNDYDDDGPATAPETAASKKTRDKQNDDSDDEWEWEFRKKVADAKNAELRAEIAQLELEKKMGNLIPYDLALSMTSVNIKDIFKTFENDLQTLAAIFCDELAGGDTAKLAKVTIRLREKLTTIVKRVEITAAKEVEVLIAEYSEVRSRGERK